MNEINDIINEMLKENYFPRSQSNEKVREKVIFEYLNLILSSDQALRQISDRSYEHENGFKKIVLYIDKKLGYKIRLHIWPKGFIQSDIHNHAWSFVSYVLKGAFFNQIYNINSQGKPYFRFEYSVDNFSLESELKYIGVDSLEKVESNFYKKGDLYTQDCNLLHKVEISKNAPTATFLIHEKPKFLTSKVFRPIINEKIIEKKHKPLKIETIIECINFVKS
ncbi:MAG: hypothetical protein AAF502_23875 [Bacteroidota bacterium]